MKFLSMLLSSNNRLNQNQKLASQRSFCQSSDQTNALETSFELLDLDDNLSNSLVDFDAGSKNEQNNQLIKDHQPNSKFIESHDSGLHFSFEKSYSPNQTKFNSKLNQFSSSGESDQLFKPKTIRKRSHKVRRQFKLDSFDCSFDNSLELNTIISIDSNKLASTTDNSIELSEKEESLKSTNDDNLKLNKSTSYLITKNDFQNKLNQLIDDNQLKDTKKRTKKKFYSNKNKQNSSSTSSQSKFRSQSTLKSISLDEQDPIKSFQQTSTKINTFKNQMIDLMTKVSSSDKNRLDENDRLLKDKLELNDNLNRKSNDNLNDKSIKQRYQNYKKSFKNNSKNTATVKTKTVSTFKRVYLRTAQIALDNSSYNVWNKKPNRQLQYHYNGSMFNLNTCTNQQQKKASPEMFNSIKFNQFKNQKCRIKAFQAYRSKSLTQIDCLDDQESNRKEDKSNTSIKDTHHHHHSATSSIHLSPQHSQQHYLQCTDNFDSQNQQFLANQTHRDYHHHHPVQHSQQESSIESSGNLTTTSNLTSGHSVHSSNLNAQATDSLIVPNLNQITPSTTSSSKDDNLPVKTIVHRGDSADNATEKQTPLRRHKQQSFNTGKRRGAVMVSCENLADDNAHQYNKTTLSNKTHHHVTRKTGSIFSNPFKNEKEKMDQLAELLDYYSINGIPNTYETHTKSISKQCSQHSQQQQVSSKTHHSTGSISSLSNILGNNAASTSTSNQQQSTTGQMHSLGASFSSATGNVQPLQTAIAIAAAAGGIGLPSSITSINQSNLPSIGLSKNKHAPLRNSKSTSSSLMTTQTGSQLNYSETTAAQSIKEDPIASHTYQEQTTADKQKAFKNQMKILKKSSIEQSVYDEDLLYLESDWSMIVKNQNELSKKCLGQQSAVWELVTTEVSYIQKLKVITNLFRDCLTSLQNECLLNDIDCDKIFSNIDEIIIANLNFWKNYLLIMLNHTRYTGDPLNVLLMAKGFFQFDEIFAPYRKYCVENLVSLQYVKKKQKESELFKAYVAWCETRKDCERLHMVDLLVAPMQRLTKYSLLLKVILTKTEDEEQLKALKQMNENVERFVISVDSSLCKRNQLEKLDLISRRIESYDAIESNNDEVDKIIKEYRDLNLMQPMLGCPKDEVRQLLLEASGLKLKDSYNSSKIDVHCLLFTDFLLICKQVSKRTSDRLKIIRQPFLISRLRTHELKDQSGLVMIYLNELNVASSFFTLYTSDTRIWLQKLKEAKKLFKNLQQISKEKEKYEQLMKNKPALQIMKSTEDEYFDDYYDISGTVQSSTNLQQPFYLQQQQQQLLLSSQFSSSRSSLIKSQSNSIDQSEASALGSNLVLAAPASTPNPLLASCCSNCGQQINLQQQQINLQQQQQSQQQQNSKAHNLPANHKHPDQQSSLTSTTLGSISLSTLESCSICNLPNVFINSTNTTTSNNNLLMSTGYPSNQINPVAGKILSNKQASTIQKLNPNQIHSKYLLNANMNLLPIDNNQQRAISFELGELRNPSITVDDLDCLGRSQSMETRDRNSTSSLRPERRAFLLKGSGRPQSGGAHSSNTTYRTNVNPHLIAAFPSNSASIDSTYSHQHYCSQCNNRISLSSSDTNNYNIVIQAGGLIDNLSFNKSTTQSNSSLQPSTHTQTSHLRQVKSLEKEYNPTSIICEEEQFVLPVPNINKIYGRSLDEILDNKIKEQQQKILNEEIDCKSNLIKTSTALNSTAINKPPLIKMKNVIMNSGISTTTALINTISQQVKSAPNSGESSPKNNLSFDSDCGDQAISDPGVLGFSNYQKNDAIKDDRRSSISKKYFLTTDNPTIKSSTSLDELEFNDQQNKVEYKLTNIPSFLISVENQEEDDNAQSKEDKNDLNNNLV